MKRSPAEAHLLDCLPSLYHLDLRDVVRPAGITQQLCDLATEVEYPAQDRSVDRQAALVCCICDPACLRILCISGLSNSECQWLERKEVALCSVARWTYDGTPLCILERHYVELLVTFGPFRISRNHIGRDTFEVIKGK